MIKQFKYIKLLGICTFLIFLGHGYQYIWWDAPWRILVWDQSLMEPVVTGIFGVTWEDYASNLSTNKVIRNLSIFTGILMLFSAFVSLLLLWKRRKIYNLLIYISSSLLFVHAFLEMKDEFYHWGHLLEHSIQIFVPITYVLYLRSRISAHQLLRILQILVIVTFAAHGLYAVGFYPVPGYFIDMIILTLGLSEDTARLLLTVVGFLDLLVVPLILFKSPLVRKWALTYVFIWGIATAFARVLANIDTNFLFSSLHQSVYLMIYRLPHGIIAWVIWLLLKEQQIKTKYFSNKLILNK